jgi:hypothetical protein
VAFSSYAIIILLYLINGTIFGKKKLLNTKYVFVFSVQLLTETFFILRRIKRDIVINVHTSLCKVPVIIVGFSGKLKFLNRFWIQAQISNFINTHPVKAEFFPCGRTDG